MIHQHLPIEQNQDAQCSSSGALTATRTYDAFGNIVSSPGGWQGPFGYAGGFGYQEDATGLKLLGHRYYDPSTGRFLTRDPIKDGRNWYVYCGNDPVSFADPEGWRRTVIIGHDVPGGRLPRLAVIGWRPDDITYHPGQYDREDAVLALIFASEAVIWAHGSPDGSIYVGGETDRIDPGTVAMIAMVRWVLGIEKMDLVQVRTCFSLATGEAVNAWLLMADEVLGYTGVTAQPWPPSIARPVRIRSQLEEGPGEGGGSKRPK